MVRDKNKTNAHSDQDAPGNRDGKLASIVYQAVSDHLCCDLNGESVILSVSSGKYYGVNSVGSFIWSLLQKPIYFEDIISGLMDEFEIDEAKCKQEVLTFLKKMKDEELVKVSDG